MLSQPWVDCDLVITNHAVDGPKLTEGDKTDQKHARVNECKKFDGGQQQATSLTWQKTLGRYGLQYLQGLTL